LNQSASSIASLETNGDDDEVTSILDDALYQSHFTLFYFTLFTQLFLKKLKPDFNSSSIFLPCSSTSS